jgi:hypothetical protein
MKFVEQTREPARIPLPRNEREAALEYLTVLRYGFEQNIIDLALVRAGVAPERHEEATAEIRRLWTLIEPPAARSQPARLGAVAEAVASRIAGEPIARAERDGALPAASGGHARPRA